MWLRDGRMLPFGFGPPDTVSGAQEIFTIRTIRLAPDKNFRRPNRERGSYAPLPSMMLDGMAAASRRIVEADVQGDTRRLGKLSTVRRQ